MKKLQLCILAAIALATSQVALARRTFNHPCITYTQGDLDRMRSMVIAKVEPYYSAFLELKNSKYSDLNQNPVNRGTQIKEGQFNGTVGRDGRCAHDMAILWHITGDKSYADKAVQFLNANSNYTNTSCRGTGPLDNGKIYLLIAAAELMRDYAGWAAEDQQRFKEMLVHPGYSTTVPVQGNSDDALNNITFYWNIYNFDAMRFGNQGLFAARAMMAMGIFLDNELIYDRAYNYLMELPRNPKDEIKYPLGRPVWSQMKNESASSIYKNDYEAPTKFGKSEYYYDETLKYYIYANGQTQEVSRDQGHAIGGVNLYGDIAEMSWNNGNDMYGALDNRILTGYEFLSRYNLSAWEPAGYTDNEDEVALDNDMYLQRLCRSTRWESLRPCPEGRGDPAGNSGTREQALAHYSVRAGLDAGEYQWLEKYRDYMIAKYGCERSGPEPNWYYEWGGWGTVTKRRTQWMAGDPVSRIDGKLVSGQHELPGVIQVPDFDAYCTEADAEGHTYHNIGKVKGNEYRADGTVEIAMCGDRWAVIDNRTGEWMNYTVGVPVTDTYDVKVTYRSKGDGVLSVTVDNGTKVTGLVTASGEDWASTVIKKVPFPAGSAVMRLGIEQEAEGLEIATMEVELASDTPPGIKMDGVIDNTECRVSVSWTYEGMLATTGDLYRSTTPDVNDAVLVSADNTIGSYIDRDVNGSMPCVYYFVKTIYKDKDYVSEPLCLEWGKLDDRIMEVGTRWFVSKGNEKIVDNCYEINFDSQNLIYIKRDQQFAFHAASYPIVAFRIDRPEGTTMSFNQNTLTYGNGTDKFTGKIGDDIYYYDLREDGMRTKTGKIQYDFPLDNYRLLNDIQLRFTCKNGNTDPLRFYWAQTFKSVDDLKVVTAGIDEVKADAESVIVVDGRLVKSLEPSSVVSVYDMSGRLLARGMGQARVRSAGDYVIAVNNHGEITTSKYIIK